MSLQIRCSVASRGLDVELDIGTGRTLALVGPNGAGKSTLVGVGAGVLRPTEGRVAIDDRVVLDTSRGIDHPAHRRSVGLLTQDPLLFPHLSVLENVAFGPRAAGLSRRVARAQASDLLATLGADRWADRRPAQLSGGQAARVALARALAPEPAVLLLDEPFAAVDAEAVPGLRALVREILGPRTAVLVTHDPLDALLLADDLAVLEDGRVREQGSTRDVLTAPRSEFAARLGGLVLLRGRAHPDGLTTAGGLVVHGETVRTGETRLTVGAPAVAVIDPAGVAVHREPPTGSPRNVWRATITAIEPRGRRLLVRTALPGSGPEESPVDAEITAAAAAELDLRPGLDVHLSVKATEVAIHPA